MTWITDVIMLLNRANNVIGMTKISSVGFSGTLVDAKLVFGIALHCRQLAYRDYCFSNQNRNKWL
jgi:hypothetical protein